MPKQKASYSYAEAKKMTVAGA